MKTPLLLLHGALGSKNQFDPLFGRLPHDLPVYAFNFPGHGGLPIEADFSIPYFAKAALDFMDANHVAAADIFGYSMGGYVALYLAWKYPARVRRVLTLGTKLDWNPEGAQREVAMLDPEKIEAKVPQFAQMLAERHQPVDWKAVLQHTASMLTALGNQPDVPPAVYTHISTPVTIGLGEQDQMVSLAESRRAAVWLPQGNFEPLPGAKHPFEQLDMDVLATWLSKWGAWV